MHLDSKNILTWGLKTGMFLILFAAIFSSVNFLLTTRVQAADTAPTVGTLVPKTLDFSTGFDNGKPGFINFANSLPSNGGTFAHDLCDGKNYTTAEYAACMSGANNSLNAAKNNANGTGGDFGTWIAQQLSGIIYVFTVGLGSLVAYVAAYFFNFAVYISLNSTAYALSFLTQGWGMVRDLANLGFIFILIYIAVKVMLEAETSGTMQTLARVIAFALIINFSFFFARVVIDGGNILAINFYNQINAPSMQYSAQNSGNTQGLANNAVSVITRASQGGKDLTASLMGAVQVQNILGTDAFEKFANNNTGFGGFFTTLITLSFIYICVGAIFALLAAMFFAIAIKFVARVVVLWVVIIAAPLAMLAAAVPNDKAQNYFKEWTHALVVYSVYPAIFLLMYIFITLFAQGLAGCTLNTPCNGSILTAAFNDINKDNTITGLPFLANLIGSIAIRLGFVMVLLYMALTVSDMVSKMAGATAQRITAKPDKWAASLSGFARRFATGPTRWAGAAATKSAGSLLSRPFSMGGSSLDKALKGSRLANQEGIFGYAGTGLRENATQPLSKVSLFGARTQSEAEKERRRQATDREANRYIIQGKEDAAKLGAIMKEWSDTTARRLQELKDLEQAKHATGNTLRLEEGEEKADLERREALYKADYDSLKDKVVDFKKSQLESLKAGEINSIISVLKEGQLKTLKDSDKFTDTQKDGFDVLWHSQSNDSPLKKANEQIKQLRKLNDNLKGFGVTIAAIDSKIGGVASPQDIVMNMKHVDQMRDAVDLQTKTLQDAIRKAAPGVDMTVERQAVRNLEKSAKRIDALEENLKNISANVGGTTNSNSFDTSKVK